VFYFHEKNAQHLAQICKTKDLYSGRVDMWLSQLGPNEEGTSLWDDITVSSCPCRDAEYGCYCLTPTVSTCQGSTYKTHHCCRNITIHLFSSVYTLKDKFYKEEFTVTDFQHPC
jgi:hypothetical protein